MEWELLFRYRGNECSQADRERFEAWLAIDPRHRATLAAIVAGVEHAGGGTRVGRERSGVGRAGRWALLTAAAGVAAFAGVREWRATSGGQDAGEPDASATRRVDTQPGERAELTLVDGTRVTLGPASVLRYAADLGAAQSREVQLEGEAYFDVAHIAERPFRVLTARTVTEDRGTRFAIRAYATDAQVRVVVAAGEVALSRVHQSGAAAATDAPAIVGSGSVAYADTGGQVRIASGVSADSYLAWTRGELVFVDTPLPDALAELGRWYDIDLRLGDVGLGKRSLTASFRGDPVDDVVHTLERVLGVRVQRDGRTMTLYPT